MKRNGIDGIKLRMKLIKLMRIDEVIKINGMNEIGKIEWKRTEKESTWMKIIENKWKRTKVYENNEDDEDKGN